MSTNTPPNEDGFEFLRKMWGNMGFGLPGLTTPTIDVDELERRIKDLKAVEGWLKTNLSMLQMTIQGLEVQRATLAAVQAMSQAGSENSNDPANNPFANPALWAWPFSAPAASEEASTSEPAKKPADEPAKPAAKRRAPPRSK